MASVKLIIPATPWPKLTDACQPGKLIVRQSFQRPLLHSNEFKLYKTVLSSQTKHLAFCTFSHDAFKPSAVWVRILQSACCNNGLLQGMLRSSVWQYRPAVLHGWSVYGKHGNDWSSISDGSGFVQGFLILAMASMCSLLLPEPQEAFLSRHRWQQEWRLQCGQATTNNVMALFQP
jgi:hypothetical protein